MAPCAFYIEIFNFFLPSDTFHVTRYTQKFTHFQEIFIFYNFHFVANLVFFTPKWSRITKLILWKVWDLEVKPSRRYSLAKALESKMAAWLCYSSKEFLRNELYCHQRETLKRPGMKNVLHSLSDERSAIKHYTFCC